MIKKILLTIGIIFLLVGCGVQNSNVIGKKPTLPSIRKPGIPSLNLKASILDSKYDTKGKTLDEMKDLLENIDDEINRPNITEEDIRRGWYTGGKGDKKYGTSDSWIWESAGSDSRWMSPNMIKEIDQDKTEYLCKKTAGAYVVSCIDTEEENCEYIPETKCNCIEGSEWKIDQGCIMTIDEEFIEINKEELNQGWYYGLPNEKKLNTPVTWIWQESGQKSRWQNPKPR